MQEPDYSTALPKAMSVEGWEKYTVTDTLKGGGAEAVAMFDVYVSTRPRDSKKDTPKPSQKGVHDTLANANALEELPNSSSADNPQPGRLPRSDRMTPGGVISPYGAPEYDPDPESEAMGSGVHTGPGERSDLESGLKVVSNDPASVQTLGDFESVKHMRGRQRRSLTLGFDTEFCYTSFGRAVLSYQWALIDPRTPEHYVRVVFVPHRLHDRARLAFMLEWLTRLLGLWWIDGYSGEAFGKNGVSATVGRYWVCHPDPEDPGVERVVGTLDEAIAQSAFEDERQALNRSAVAGVRSRNFRKAPTADPSDQLTEGLAGYRFDMSKVFAEGLKITILSHFGLADLSTFAEESDDWFFMRRLTSAGGGLVSDRPVRVLGKDQKRRWYWPFRVEVRDTLTYAPAGMGSLKSLGLVAGVPKIDLPEGYKKADMLKFRTERFADFLEYGANDAVICAEYSAQLWGENMTLPLTLPTASASALRASGIEYLGLGSEVNEHDEKRSANARFSEVFSGLTPEDSEKFEDYSVDDGYSYFTERQLKPIDEAASVFMNACANSYRGGYNAISEVGHIVGQTYDLDLANAYPTAMACVLDVDYEHEQGVIRRTVGGWEELHIEDFPSYDTPFVGYIRFEFPESVQFPCIPVPVVGSVIYPRTSGKAGVYAVGPEVKLALHLGARVWVQHGSFAHVLRPDGETPSRVLRYAVRQLINDRKTAKETFGKGSIQELLFKTAVNSGYGKTAQDVSARSAWSALVQEYGGVGGSAITSAYHATMTTSITRAELLATMNELHEAGYKTFSVTTDGFITDAPLEVVQGLSMYGMKPMIEDARKALSGSTKIWEQKHEQTAFLNTMTRQNVSLEEGGVIAHGGYRTADHIEVDSMEDRVHMYKILTNRTGPVPNIIEKFPSFKEMTVLDPEKRQDFEVTRVRKKMRFVDVKRKPVSETLRTDQVTMPDGEIRTIVHYETEPWETAKDFRRARELSKGFDHLGTEEAVKDFLFKVDHSGLDFRVSRFGRKWDILRTILMGHRQGIPELQIPTLSAPKLTVSEKCEWLSSWDMKDGSPVTESDWKNARRTDRQNDSLSLDELEPYLSILKNQPVGRRGYPLD
jgi:hypothetical protein